MPWSGATGIDTPSKERTAKKLTIGWRECFHLPQLDIDEIVAKIDTGARTSALHAIKIRHFNRDGKVWIRFKVHPHQRESKTTVDCEAPLYDEREIRSSNGETEVRPVIRTRISHQGRTFPIELTLTNRSQMGFRMLIGREALRRRFLIDCGQSWLGGKPEPQDKPKT